MVDTTDGFELAELDLKLRGYGDLEGTQQSGEMIDLKIADLGRDTLILERARAAAIEVVEEDAELALAKNSSLRDNILLRRKDSGDYSNVL